MKTDQLIEQNLTKKIEENLYICLICNKSFTKLGVGVHHFYEHDANGKLAKEKLREIAKKQNNTPEMKKKISENTKKVLEKQEIKNKMIKAANSEKHKNAVSQSNKRRMSDPEYKEKFSKKIKDNYNTEEFKEKMSNIITSIHNDPNATVKSDWFRTKMKETTTALWKNPEERRKREKSAKKAWNNKTRRLKQSTMAKKLWSDPNHIEKVLDGKIRFLVENGLPPSLGKYGQTESGLIYESNFEKEVFEFLEQQSINFKTHVKIPTSRKICDIVIDNIWIELDGLNRDRLENSEKYGWGNKIDIYNRLKKLGIIKDFIIFKNPDSFKKWFREISNGSLNIEISKAR